MNIPKVKLYAEALAEIMSKGIQPSQEKTIIDNFVKLLIKAGFEKKAKMILDFAEDLFLAKQGKRKICLETVRKITANQKKTLAGFFKNGDVVREKINPEIIAGIKITINGEKQFDASIQSKLQSIFK